MHKTEPKKDLLQIIYLSGNALIGSVLVRYTNMQF